MAGVRQRILTVASVLAVGLAVAFIAAATEPNGEGSLDQLSGPISAAYTVTITGVSRSEDACNAIFVATYEPKEELWGSAPQGEPHCTLTALVPLLVPLCPRVPGAVLRTSALPPFAAGDSLVVVHTEEWGKLWFETRRLDAIKRILSRAEPAASSS